MNNIINEDKKTIYVDFDMTIVNSIKKICEMYNEDFKYYDGFIPADWTKVNMWDFQDQCPLLNRSIVDYYFNQSRLFENLKFMENAFEYLDKLHSKYNIVVISMGDSSNLYFKEQWLKENLCYNFKPLYDEFIGCEFGKVEDKAHINMSGSVLIDDSLKNLRSCSADVRILYGDDYSWNEGWEGIRFYNWKEVYCHLMKNGE